VRPPKLLFLQNTDYYSEVFASRDVPIRIAEAQETTIVSVLPNNVQKTVLDVNCLINVEHSNVEDLSVSLISPAGTEVVLVGGINIYHDVPPYGSVRTRSRKYFSQDTQAPLSHREGDGEGAFTNTIFDDEAAVSITDTNYGPPYTGRFRPIEHLWWFDGENSFGEWKLKIVDNGIGAGGTLLAWNMEVRYSAINENVAVPGSFALVMNFPNPFNPSTRIVFDVPYPAMVKIVIYDILGRQIGTILDERRTAKPRDFVDFNSLDKSINDGRGLPSGVYFYTLYADGNFIASKRMVLLK